MKISKDGAHILRTIEGFRLFPYNDQTGKPVSEWCPGATIGVGHLIKKGEWDAMKDGISEEFCDNLLSNDVAETEGTIMENVHSPLNQNQFDALVMLVFNIGKNAFLDSSVLKWLNGDGMKSNYPSLELAWAAWNKSQGEVMDGLVYRREVEWSLFTQ